MRQKNQDNLHKRYKAANNFKYIAGFVINKKYYKILLDLKILRVPRNSYVNLMYPQSQ